MKPEGWMKKQGIVILLVIMLGVPGQVKAVQSNHFNDYLDVAASRLSTSSSSLFEQTLLGFTYLGLGEWEKAEAQILIGKEVVEKNKNLLTSFKLWLALLSFQFDFLTEQNKYGLFGEKLCLDVCSLPTYNDLPVMGKRKDIWNVDWSCFVALEDIRFGIEVLDVATQLTLNLKNKKTFEVKKQKLIQALPLFESFPENSFFVFSYLDDQSSDIEDKRKSYFFNVSNGLYFVSDQRKIAMPKPGKTKRTLAYFAGLMREEQSERAIAKYEKARRSINGLRPFSVWKKENQLKIYDRSHLASLNKKEDWFFPDRFKDKFSDKGLADICFDFIKTYSHPLKLQKTVVVKEELNSLILAKIAKRHLLTGEYNKAERWAKKSVATDQDRDAVASSWLILGKIYRDKADHAKSDFKFVLADQYQEKSEHAFQTVARHYPTASVIDSKSSLKRVVEIIQGLYQ